MKQFLFVIILFFITGCGTPLFTSGGKNTRKVEKLESKLEQVDNQALTLSDQRLDLIGEYSYGLTISSNNSLAVNELNNRIQALSNQPTLESMQEMRNIVNQLLTNNTVLLEHKDKQINNLYTAIEKLKQSKDKAVSDYMALANRNAALADNYANSLSSMDRWLGLGAVYYGLKKFIISSMWIIGIGGILFVILRIASMSNPLAASIFNIFTLIASWLVNVIKFLVPKAIEATNHVTSALFNSYKSTLTKLVDAIQLAKHTESTTGKPASLTDILTEVSKQMNGDEKEIIDEIKKAINWK